MMMTMHIDESTFYVYYCIFVSLCRLNPNPKTKILPIKTEKHEENSKGGASKVGSRIIINPRC